MKRGFVDTPEGQIHYCFEGSGDPLLLLHPTPRGVDAYLELIPPLAKGSRAIAMDTIGYGDSYKPRSQPSIEDYAEGVVSLLDGLNIKTASIMGRATGSIIAIEVAAAYPERVDKLVLYSATYVDERVGRQIMDLTKDLEWRVREDGSHLTDMWNFVKERALTGGWPQGPSLQFINRQVAAYLRAGEIFCEFGRNAVASYAHMGERLKLIQSPTLMISGIGDAPWVKESRPMFRKLIPRCKAVEIEANTDTMTHTPDKIAKVVRDFLSNPGI